MSVVRVCLSVFVDAFPMVDRHIAVVGMAEKGFMNYNVVCVPRSKLLQSWSFPLLCPAI